MRRAYTLPEMKTTGIAIALLACLLLAGCMQDDPRVPTPDELPSREVLFSVSIPKSSATRALSTADESRINNIHVLAFQYDAYDGNFHYAYHSIGKQAANTETTVTYTITAHVLKEKQQFVIIANADAEVNELIKTLPHATTHIEKYSLLRRLQIDLSTTGGRWDIGSEDTPGMPIPMWGESDAVTISSTTTSITDKPLALLRMVARIDVSLATDQPEKTLNKFRMKEVYLYNPQAHGSIVPSQGAYSATSQSVLTVTLPTDEDGNTYQPLTTPILYKEVYPADLAMQGVIYTLETKATDDRMQSTCLVVGGQYDKTGTFDGVRNTYYRVDIVSKQDGKEMDILRNHHYLINITEVMGEGYETPELAFNSKPVNLTAEVLQWNQPHMDNVVFDGTSVLGLSEGEFKYYRNEERKEVEEGNVLYVYTDFQSNDESVPSGWYIKSVTDGNGKSYSDFKDCWLQLHDKMHELVPVGAGRGNKDVHAPGVNTQLHFYFDAIADSTVDGRSLVIVFAAGRLEYSVTITQSEEFLCDIRLHYTNDDEPDGLAYELVNGSMITFVSTPGVAPNAKTIVMDVVPRDKKVEISWSGVGTTVPPLVDPNNGFTPDKGWKNIFTDIDPETGKGKLRMQPTALQTEVEKKEGRLSIVTLKMEYDSKVVTRIFSLRQMEYSGEVSDMDTLYLMGDDNHALTLKSNVWWQAEVQDDPCNILDLKTTRGSANTVTGTRVKFAFKDFVQSYRTHKDAYLEYQREASGIGMASAKIVFFHINEKQERIDLASCTLYASPLILSQASVNVPARCSDPNNPVPLLSDPIKVRGKTGESWMAWFDLDCQPSATRKKVVARDKDGNITQTANIYLHNHHVSLVDASGQNVLSDTPVLTYKEGETEDIPTISSQAFNASFRFRFDPIQFPNRMIPGIVSHVRFCIPVDDEYVWIPNATVIARQDMLEARPATVWGPRDLYGCLFSGITRNLRQVLLTRMGMPIWESATELNNRKLVSNSYPDPPTDGSWRPFTYIQFGYGDNWENSAGTYYPRISQMRTISNQGDVPIWLLGIDPNTWGIKNATDALNGITPNGGYTLVGGRGGAVIADIKPSYLDDDRKKLVYKFVMGQYPNAERPLINTDFNSYNSDDICSRLTAYPPTVVPIIRYNSGDNNVLLSIDPVNNVIYSGEDQMHEGMSDPPSSGNQNGRDKFFINLIDYIVQSSGYGKLFTKLLIGDEDTASGHLWDAETWGDNVYPN